MITLGNGKDIDKDIELCRTTNERISDQTVRLLIERRIPFTKNKISIPFFLRERFHGASGIYIIRTHPNRYSQARRALDELDVRLRRRLVVSNY